jgi:lysophospholipase L1-like esterase
LKELQVTAASVALPKAESGQNLSGSKTILSETIQTLTFNGLLSVDIPSGALVVSDPILFPLLPAQIITVSIFLRQGQAGGQITSHPGSRTQTWMIQGDNTQAADFTEPTTRSTFHWYFLSCIEAWQARENSAFVLIGDSLTDGRGSTDNANDRWPDLLFNRMLVHPFARNISVLNQAAGGNRVLKDGKGRSVLSRLDRDVFSQSGVRYVMIFHGVNDIGTAEPDVESQEMVGEKLIQAYRQIISLVHAFGIPVFCSTIAPFMAPSSISQPYAIAAMEVTRQRINAWMRNEGAFDAVIDFDVVLRDPLNKSFLKEEFNSGDYLHPNVRAYQAMAEAFPLEIFERFAGGVQGFE